NHADWVFHKGIAPDGGGAKHRRFGPTCQTAAAAGATCRSSYPWKSPFPDENYTPVCWGIGTRGPPILSLGDIQTPDTLTVQVQSATAASSSFRAVYCVAMHD